MREPGMTRCRPARARVGRQTRLEERAVDREIADLLDALARRAPPREFSYVSPIDRKTRSKTLR